MAIADKKKKIIVYLVKNMKLLDPTGANSKRYQEKLEAMSDKQFDKFMHDIKEGKEQIHLVVLNMKRVLKQEQINAAAASVGTKLFHKLWITDASTGRRFLTPEEYPIYHVPIRRTQQFIDKKMSVPDGHSTIDMLTGQVTADDRASSITNPEIHAYYARGLKKALQEVVKVRGGDINAMSEFARQIEETGKGELDQLDPNTKTRSSVMSGVLLRGMHLDANF